MAKIPSLNRLLSEDFKEQSGWIDRLISPINLFMERITGSLDHGLTIGDNFAGTIRTVELDGTWPVKVAWDVIGRPQTVLVGNVYRSDGTAFSLTTAVQVQWTFNQSGQLQIEAVTGITPTNAARYKVVLECKAG